MDAWLHTAAVPRPLKQRIRAYYSGALPAGVVGGRVRSACCAIEQGWGCRGSGFAHSGIPAASPADVWLRHAATHRNVGEQFSELPHALRQEVSPLSLQAV